MVRAHLCRRAREAQEATLDYCGWSSDPPQARERSVFSKGVVTAMEEVLDDYFGGAP